MKYVTAFIAEVKFMIECRLEYGNIFRKSAWERFPLKNRIAYWMDPMPPSGLKILSFMLDDVAGKL